MVTDTERDRREVECVQGKGNSFELAENILAQSKLIDWMSKGNYMQELDIIFI